MATQGQKSELDPKQDEAFAGRLLSALNDGAL
jgi:hypothetical protein